MFKFYFNTPQFMDALDIYILDERLDGSRGILAFDKGAVVVSELKDYSASVETPPTIRLSGHHAKTFLKDLADALDRQGIKTDSDAKKEGKLEAIQAHLEDLRSLVFMKK